MTLLLPNSKRNTKARKKMGYRHYFYKVKKTDVETVKNMSYEQLSKYVKERGGIVVEEDNWIDLDGVLDQTEVHEFGKLYWDDTAERIYGKGVPLFSRNEVQEQFCDYVPYVVGKEGLFEAIKIYQEKIIYFYRDMLVDGQDRSLPFGITLRQEDVKSVDKLVEHIKDKLFTLEKFGLVDLDEKNKWQVAHSWEYEHSIFNLVHILKAIDWEQDTLLFYGW